jgi:hypothetical protein
MDIVSDLKRLINSNDTVLDLGCGIKTYSYFGKTTTVDAWDKLTPDYLLDLEKDKLPFGENTFDHILMIDFIEHLDKDKGKVLLNDCKKIVKNKIFVFTPLVFNDNSINVNNPSCWAHGNKYDYHKSLWTLDDFSDWVVLFKNNVSFFGYWKK